MRRLMTWHLPQALTTLSIVLIGAGGLLGGCGDVYTNASMGGGIAERIDDIDLVSNSHRVTERLIDTSQQILDPDKPIIVASLVNVTDLEESSVLGRIIGEQIRSRLTQLGYMTREMRFRGNILVREGSGELALSRDAQKIRDEQEAQAVIVGVYAVAENAVYVTLRLIRAHDSAVLSSFDYSLPKNDNISSLLELDPLFTY